MEDSPETLLRKADQKAQGHAFSFLSGGPHYDEAAQLYSFAGNKYKLNKKFKEAAECFLKVAFMQQKMGDFASEARAYVEAANLVKNYSPGEAVVHYNKATEIYNNNGRFAQSAKMMKEIAELFEEEKDFKQAIIFYKKAAEFFDMDEYGKSQYSQCIIKYADLSAKVAQNYREAIKIYEKEGEKALRNTLIQFSAKDFFFKAGILLLALDDSVDAKIACDRYDEIDPRFSGSREGKLLRKLVECQEAADLEGFVEALREYDSITKLDAWKINFLYKAKDAMTPASERLRNAAVSDDEDPNNVDLT